MQPYHQKTFEFAATSVFFHLNDKNLIFTQQNIEHCSNRKLIMTVASSSLSLVIAFLLLLLLHRLRLFSQNLQNFVHSLVCSFIYSFVRSSDKEKRIGAKRSMVVDACVDQTKGHRQLRQKEGSFSLFCVCLFKHMFLARSINSKMGGIQKGKLGQKWLTIEC